MASLLEQLKRNPEIDMESPFCLEIEGNTHPFQCLIRGYGSENGVIVDENFNRISPVKNALIEMGYGFSCIDIWATNRQLMRSSEMSCLVIGVKMRINKSKYTEVKSTDSSSLWFCLPYLMCWSAE